MIATTEGKKDWQKPRIIYLHSISQTNAGANIHPDASFGDS